MDPRRAISEPAHSKVKVEGCREGTKPGHLQDCHLDGEEYFLHMNEIEELRESALKLAPKDRAAFAAWVLATLPPPDHRVSDEDAAKRLEELRSGAVKGLTTKQLTEEIERQTA